MGKKFQWLSFFGRAFINTEIYSYILSLSFLVVAAISPFLSGIADYTGSKKKIPPILLLFRRIFMCHVVLFRCESHGVLHDFCSISQCWFLG